MKDRRNRARTHYIHRISFTTQEQIAGLFVFIAIGILVWLLLSSGKSSIAFEDAFTLYGQLESAQQDINKDTEIKISGLTAGHIESIDVQENNTVIITMNITQKYQTLLRTDSTAKLTNPGVAVLGGSVIHITAGSSNKPMLEDGSTISIAKTASIKETLEAITPTFEQLQASIQKVNEILNAIDPEIVGTTFDNVQEASTYLKDISSQISQGEGLAGAMIYDEGIDANTKAIVKNLLDITVLLEEITATLNQEVSNMPELVDRIGPILNQADRTIKATQRIWPLSTAIGEEKNKDILTSPAPAAD